jgi:hypothetical protein
MFRSLTGPENGNKDKLLKSLHLHRILRSFTGPKDDEIPVDMADTGEGVLALESASVSKWLPLLPAFVTVDTLRPSPPRCHWELCTVCTSSRELIT